MLVNNKPQISFQAAKIVLPQNASAEVKQAIAGISDSFVKATQYKGTGFLKISRPEVDFHILGLTHDSHSYEYAITPRKDPVDKLTRKFPFVKKINLLGENLLENLLKQFTEVEKCQKKAAKDFPIRCYK